jgi:glyoxylase-like metal-dependent hydrolase (beta-lactamase superfamily II)
MLVVPGLHASETTHGARAYLVEGPMECVLVDTGAPDGGLGAAHLVDRSGRPLHEVRLIVLTSADPLHAGNAAAFRELSGAPVAASAQTAARLREARTMTWRRGLLRRRAEPWPPSPVRIDEVLTPGDVLEIAGGVEVLDAGDGALAFHCYGPNALMTGDASPRGFAQVRARVICPARGLPTVDGRRPSRVPKRG